MRSSFAPSLSLALALVAGCGDNLTLGDDPGDHDFGGGALDDPTTIAKLVPEICAARAWPDIIMESKDADVRAIPMEQGVAVLHVDRNGGPLRGFLADTRGLVIGDRQGVKVLDGRFTGVSATQVDGRLIAAVVEGMNVRVNVLRDDLGDFRLLETISGNAIGDTTIMHARGNRVTAVGGVTGIVSSSYDQAWAPMGTEVIARSVPDSNMTSAAYGNDAMVAWSSGGECHLQRVASGFHSSQNAPCPNARLATDYYSRGGQLVYEGGDGLLRADIRVSSHNEIANENILVPHGKAPRIAFDGVYYWVSYLNFHGDVVVGYLEEDGSLLSMALEGVRPADGAYDLAVIDGSVWVYTADTAGFSANRICLVREGS